MEACARGSRGFHVAANERREPEASFRDIGKRKGSGSGATPLQGPPDIFLNFAEESVLLSPHPGLEPEVSSGRCWGLGQDEPGVLGPSGLQEEVTLPRAAWSPGSQFGSSCRQDSPLRKQ